MPGLTPEYPQQEEQEQVDQRAAKHHFAEDRVGTKSACQSMSPPIRAVPSFYRLRTTRTLRARSSRSATSIWRWVSGWMTTAQRPRRTARRTAEITR